MTSHQKSMRMTVDTFLDWAMAQPSGRFELHAGAVVAMSPERVSHMRAKLETVIALRAAIRERGLDCEAMTDGVSVRIDEVTLFEPDALVRCGPRTPGEAISIDDPLIVVEVVSPSSRGIDSGSKLAGYFRLPGLCHYLVIDTEARVVIHHRRDAAGAISVQLLTDGSLLLDPPGLTIGVGDIFTML